MTDSSSDDWAEHAAAEGAAVSADPGESGDVASPVPAAAGDGADPQVEAAERAPHHAVTD